MPTPTSSPKLLQSWKNLYAKFTSQGYSKNKAFECIARKYNTTRETVYYWLDSSYKQSHLEWSKRYSRLPEVREKNRQATHRYYYRRKKDIKLYSKFFKNVQAIFEKVFEEKELLTSDEIYKEMIVLKEDEKYKKTFKEIFSMLPVEEIKHGIYKLEKKS